MKLKSLTVLAAVVVASSVCSVALASQKHDVKFQDPLVFDSQKNDPDLTRQIRYQNGSPKGKADLYVARPASTEMDRDLVRNIRYMDGSPKSKSEQRFEIAPLK
jgi:hypothetical protein